MNYTTQAMNDEHKKIISHVKVDKDGKAVVFYKNAGSYTRKRKKKELTTTATTECRNRSCPHCGGTGKIRGYQPTSGETSYYRCWGGVITA